MGSPSAPTQTAADELASSVARPRRRAWGLGQPGRAVGSGGRASTRVSLTRRLSPVSNWQASDAGARTVLGRGGASQLSGSRLKALVQGHAASASNLCTVLSWLPVVCLCIDRHSQCQHVPEGSGVCEDPYPPDCAVPSEPLSQLGSMGVGTRPVVQAPPQRSGLWWVCCRRQGALVPSPFPDWLHSPSGVLPGGGGQRHACSLPPSRDPHGACRLPRRPPFAVLGLSASTQKPGGSVRVSGTVQPLVVPSGAPRLSAWGLVVQ